MHFTLSGAKVKVIYSYANELYNIDFIFCVEYTHNSFILLVFQRPDDCSVMSTYYKEEPQPMLMVVNKHHNHVYSNGEDSVNVSSQTVGNHSKKIYDYTHSTTASGGRH